MRWVPVTVGVLAAFWGETAWLRKKLVSEVNECLAPARCLFRIDLGEECL